MSSFLALCANLAFPLDHHLPDQSTVWGTPSPFWDAFARHDSGWYFDIARNGYDATAAVAGGRSNIAFAPVYPMLMRYVGRLFGRAPGDVYLGGIVVSWLSFALAMVVLYRLAALDLPRRRAERAVLLTAIFPFSFFFGAVYTESTFLLFTLLAFYGFRTRRWALGGVARRHRHGDARHRHHDVAGAGLDRVARGEADRGAIASRRPPALVGRDAAGSSATAPTSTISPASRCCGRRR